MPWVPELFSASALQRLLQERRREKLVSVPFFAGVMAGEVDALVESFAGEPVLYDPVRGRVQGVQAFETFVTEMNAWLKHRNASVGEVGHVILERHGFEEVVLHLDGDRGPVDLPVAIVADHPSDGFLTELRVYSSSWPLTGRHANRTALLQPDPGLRPTDIVGDYQRALAAGDVDAVVATFEADGYSREPAGSQYVHQGPDGLRAFYERMFSNNGGIRLEYCTLMDDQRTCALEYNVVRWGKTELPPQAGVAVYARGETGKLAAARIYDDTDPPIAPPT